MENKHSTGVYGKVVILIPKDTAVSLRGKEWTIVALSQGFPTLHDLSKKVDMSLNEFTEALKLLKQKGIIKIGDRKSLEPDSDQAPISPRFWNTLRTEFSTIIGPIASTIIDEELEYLRERHTNVTKKDLPDLIEKLSLEIDNRFQRIKFQKTMIEVLKTL